MEKIELFVQGEGIKEIMLVEVPSIGQVKDILKAVEELSGVPHQELAVIFLEDEEHEVDLDKTLEAAGIHHRKHIHLHRCHKILVTVHFNGEERQNHFSPSTRIKRIKKWAAGPHGFNMSELDASEHALQICGSDIRPNEDEHIGKYASFPTCMVCFDLVPKQRVEG